MFYIIIPSWKTSPECWKLQGNERSIDTIHDGRQDYGCLNGEKNGWGNAWMVKQADREIKTDWTDKSGEEDRKHVT